MVNYARAPPRKPLFCLIIRDEIGKTLFTSGKDKKNRVDELARRTDQKARVHSEFRVREQCPNSVFRFVLGIC